MTGEEREGARARIAVLGLAVAAFAFITAETLPIALLPLIARDLRIGLGSAGSLVTVYAVVVLAATVPLARLTARLPRRPLLGGVTALLAIATAGSAASPALGLLMATRVLTALAHAVFWAVVVPAAASLMPEARRGRAVATVYAGQSVATVAGIPAGVVIGSALGWRAAFLGVSAIAVLALATIAPLLRPHAAVPSGAAAATRPDRRHYLVLIAVTAVAVTGTFAAYTYVNPYLTDVSGLPTAALGAVLAVRGVAGLVAVLGIGRLVDRRPHAAVAVPLAVQVAALLAQWAGGGSAPVAVAAIVVSGAAGAAFSAALGARVLVVAPGSLDVATAGSSTAYNVGIAGGSALGGGVLGLAGLAQVPLVAGALVLVAAVAAAVARPRADPGAGPRTLAAP